MERKAMELVKKGLKFDMKSHVCWHAYGVLCRSRKDYKMAIKCFTNALKRDNKNRRVLVDLSTLQVQMKDYEAYCETRRLQLTLDASSMQRRQNWLGLSVAHHLAGHHDLALAILEQYMTTLDDSRDKGYEDCDMVMYRVKLLEVTASYTEALKVLEAAL